MEPDQFSDANEVLRRLRDYSDRIKAIMDAIGDKRTLAPNVKSEVQTLLTALKADLKDDAHRCGLVRNRGKLTHLEKTCLCPAVQQASAGFHVATNSDPIRSDWHSNLYSIRIDIEYPMSYLEELLGGDYE